MRRIIPAAVLACAAACVETRVQDPSPAGSTDPGRVDTVRVEQLYEVLDENDRTRLGFVEKTVESSGRRFYVVTNLEREDLGFILENGRAYRNRWHADGSRLSHEDLGADTIETGVRLILEHDSSVDLEPITERQLGEELRRKRAGGGGGDGAQDGSPDE